MEPLSIDEARALLMARDLEDAAVGAEAADADGAPGADDAADVGGTLGADADGAPGAAGDTGVVGVEGGEGFPNSADAAADASDAVADAPDTVADAPDAVSDAPDAVSYDGDRVGLGVDIVEIERMRRLLERTPSFAERVFSQAERDYCQGKANAAAHYALRFAAKEAVVKALGTGFSEGIWVNDIEVERAGNGRPTVKLSGRALEVARERGVRDLSISLSYTHTEAVACVMAITDAAMRATEKRKDPMEELARQFKETRGILDEL